MPPPFAYSPTILARLEQSISVDRLSTYLAAANNDREEAFKLYVWNTAISAAFYGPLQTLEISIRNSFHRELSQLRGTRWYDSPALPLTPQARNAIRAAKDKLTADGKPHDPGRIIAELSFGFWERLLTKGPGSVYEMRLWRPALHKAFPHAHKRRSDVHLPIQHLRVLRNRIAHHEPIFPRHLAKDYQTLTEVLGWICPDTRAWVEHHSEVQTVLGQRP